MAPPLKPQNSSTLSDRLRSKMNSSTDTVEDSSADSMQNLFRDFESRISAKIDASTKTIQSSITKINESLAIQRNDIDVLKSEMSSLACKTDKFAMSVNKTEDNYETLDREVRKINLIFSGLADSVDETVESLHRNVASIILHITGNQVNFDIATRIGSLNNHRTRQVKVRFHRMENREFVWNSRKNTKPPIFINEDLPFTMRRDFAVIRKKAKDLKDQNVKCEINWSKRTITTDSDKLFVNEGKIHTQQTNNPSSSQAFLGATSSLK